MPNPTRLELAIRDVHDNHRFDPAHDPVLLRGRGIVAKQAGAAFVGGQLFLKRIITGAELLMRNNTFRHDRAAR